MTNLNKILFVLGSCILSSVVQADEKVILGGESTVQQYIPVALSLNIGSLGYGAALMWDTQPNVGVTLGYKSNELFHNKGLWNSLGQVKRQNTHNRYTFLQLEWKPWQQQSMLLVKSSYISLGVAYTEQKIFVNHPAHEQESPLNQQHLSPYFGIGVRPMLGLHWGWLAELGVYYTPQSILISQQKNLQFKSEVKDQWSPTAQVGVVYHF